MYWPWTRVGLWASLVSPGGIFNPVCGINLVIYALVIFNWIRKIEYGQMDKYGVNWTERLVG